MPMQQPQHPGNIQLDKSDNDTATEHFLVYGYKVVPCSKRYRHDWSVCPFAHTGEMAARRDPSRYLPIFCFHSKQRLPCPRGDDCPYSHNLFEYWLHPQRYRTEMCQFGAACTRPVCFFAHGEHQLRHTTMPGGPQPVVAPPEPIPALNGGFGSRDLNAPVDPAVKQQQQLMALQAAAAGFSQQQQQQQQQAAAAAAAAACANMRGDLLHPVDPLVAAGGLQHVGSYPIMDGGGSMDMSALQSQLGLAAAGHLPASSPLSAPLPQLSPDMLAAFQSIGAAPAGPVSPLGGGLLHQHSGIPVSSLNDMLPPPGRLQRSVTAHPAVNAAAAAAAVAGSSNSNLDDLAKHLSLMQLMQQAGVGASNVSGPQQCELGAQPLDLLGLAQLQQQQQQQHDQRAVVAAAPAPPGSNMDFVRMLPPATAGFVSSSRAADSSFSCPLPPVFGNGLPAGHAGSLSPPVAAVSCNLPRVPTAPGNGFGSPSSPSVSDNGRDAPSPAGANGCDAQVPAPNKKGQPWSAPVSPCSNRGNDLVMAPDDVKLSSLSIPTGHHSSSASSTSSSGAGGSVGRLNSMTSEQLVHGLSTALSMHEAPSFSAGFPMSASATGAAGSDSSPLLVVGDSPLEASQVQSALRAGASSDASRAQHHAAVQQQLGAVAAAAQQHGIGHDKAVELLSQLPEEAVKKLLTLMQQGEAGKLQQ